MPRRPASFRLPLLVVLCGPGALGAQVVARSTLEGTAFVGGGGMPAGTVVLHHLTNGEQGDLDSVNVGIDGAFAFELPYVPDPDRGDVFFASVRYDGVLYFGPAVTTAVQLDSVYDIYAYDTLMAPLEGALVPLQSRSVFLEPDSSGWRVTDLFQLRNDEDRTIVARRAGLVWLHPLPSEAREVVVGEGEVAIGAASYEQGGLVVRAALPPGEHIFVARYRLDSPIVDIPNRGTTEVFDVLVREPAPPLAVEGLDLLGRIELEAGSTYMRFTGVDVSMPSVRIVETEAVALPPVQWLSVMLALVLTVGGLLALRGAGPVFTQRAEDREALLLTVARLDEDFERNAKTTLTRRDYERRRADLIRKLRSER